MSTQVSEILDLLRSGWCQGRAAYNHQDANDQVITDYCLVGAMSKVWRGYPSTLLGYAKPNLFGADEREIVPTLELDQRKLIEQLADIIREEHPQTNSVPNSIYVLLWYNDLSEQSQDKIIELLESVG
jgi:hypothetical protein